MAGAVAAWVLDAFWRHLFLTGHPALLAVRGLLAGPLVAVIGFVCSIGNMPLALVLWKRGISFGGVVSFIFGDLIILAMPTHLQEVLRPAHGLVPAVDVCAQHGHAAMEHGCHPRHAAGGHGSPGTGSGQAETGPTHGGG